jgi:hypothetical protein
VWVNAFPDAYANVVGHEVNGNTVTTTVRGGGTFTGQMAAPDGSMIPGNGSTLDLEYVQTFTSRAPRSCGKRPITTCRL